MKKTLTVLQDDIDNGVQRSSESCAVALAAKREWNLEIVEVGVGSVFCEIDGERYRGLFSEEVSEFINRFDCFDPPFHGRPLVEPFKFEVDLLPLSFVHFEFGGSIQ